jgi:hypothetical protein
MDMETMSILLIVHLSIFRKSVHNWKPNIRTTDPGMEGIPVDLLISEILARTSLSVLTKYMINLHRTPGCQAKDDRIGLLQFKSLIVV